MPVKIAIIGAGPVGLLLARLLNQVDKGMDFETFHSARTLDDSRDYIFDAHSFAGQISNASPERSTPIKFIFPGV